MSRSLPQFNSLLRRLTFEEGEVSLIYGALKVDVVLHTPWVELSAMHTLHIVCVCGGAPDGRLKDPVWPPVPWLNSSNELQYSFSIVIPLLASLTSKCARLKPKRGTDPPTSTEAVDIQRERLFCIEWHGVRMGVAGLRGGVCRVTIWFGGRGDGLMEVQKGQCGSGVGLCKTWHTIRACIHIRITFKCVCAAEEEGAPPNTH